MEAQLRLKRDYDVLIQSSIASAHFVPLLHLVRHKKQDFSLKVSSIESQAKLRMLIQSCIAAAPATLDE